MKFEFASMSIKYDKALLLITNYYCLELIEFNFCDFIFACAIDEKNNKINLYT